MNNYEKFKKGTMEMLLLKLLSQKDLYGYEIVQLFKNLSDGIIIISVGNMYPMLYKLEEKGWITSYKKSAGKRLERIYYHLTDLGLEEFNKMVKDYEHLISATQNILDYKYDEKEGTC